MLGRILGLLWVTAVSGPYLVLWPDALLPLAERVLPNGLWRGQARGDAVALTFDDGPDPVYTPQVLKILARDRIRATFFLVGERARQYPNLVAAIRDAGHMVGNHSDSWRSTRSLSTTEFEADLLRAEESLGLRGAPVKLFRPAGGLIGRAQARIARGHGYRIVYASVLPFDPYRPPSAWITLLVARSLQPGAIVVLHDSGGDRKRTIAALPQIIRIAQGRDLRFLTVAELQ